MANNTYGNMQVSTPDQSVSQTDSLQVSIPTKINQGSKMILAQASPITVRKAQKSIPTHP